MDGAAGVWHSHLGKYLVVAHVPDLRARTLLPN